MRWFGASMIDTKTEHKTDTPPPLQDDKLYKPSAAALFLSVCPQTLRRWEKDGLLDAVRLNARVTRYRGASIRKLIEAEV